MAFTDYSSRLMISHLLGRSIYTPPETLYVALSTTVPSKDKENTPFWHFTEPNGYGYSRVSYINTIENWLSFEDSTETHNNSIIEFPKALGPWGIITAFGMFDEPIDGNLLVYGLLWDKEANEPATQTITNGDVASFPVGFINIDLS